MKNKIFHLILLLFLTGYASSAKEPSFSLRTNLASWALLTPDLGIEWKHTERISTLVHGSYTRWDWKNDSRRYRIGKVTPEVRYFPTNNKQLFIGLNYLYGKYNVKFRPTGRQGKMQGGGITGGYKWPIKKHFGIDISMGAGYTQYKYSTYERKNQQHIRKEEKRKNYWGITQIAVSLSYSIGSAK